MLTTTMLLLLGRDDRCRYYATPAASSPSPAAGPSSTPKEAPSASTSQSSVSPKVSQIVDQISTLSLLEAAELVSTLKVRKCEEKSILLIFPCCCDSRPILPGTGN